MAGFKIIALCCLKMFTFRDITKYQSDKHTHPYKSTRKLMLRGATQKFGEFKQRARTGCQIPFRR
jgi:hypothetical protein